MARRHLGYESEETLTPFHYAHAWCVYQGSGTAAILASYRFTSITDNGVGDWTLTMSEAVKDNRYGLGALQKSNGFSPTSHLHPTIDPTTSTIRVRNIHVAGVLQDTDRGNLVVFANSGRNSLGERPSPSQICRAWINFSGETTPASINDSYGVASLTDLATGNYTVTFVTSFKGANTYAGAQCTRRSGVLDGICFTCVDDAPGPAADSITLITVEVNGPSVFDAEEIMVAFWGD